jgi:hypothetical protein
VTSTSIERTSRIPRETPVLPRESLEERSGGASLRIVTVVAIVSRQVEQDLAVARMEEVTNDEDTVRGELLDLGRQRPRGGLVVVSAEGGDVVQDR